MSFHVLFLSMALVPVATLDSLGFAWEPSVTTKLPLYEGVTVMPASDNSFAVSLSNSRLPRAFLIWPAVPLMLSRMPFFFFSRVAEWCLLRILC